MSKNVNKNVESGGNYLFFYCSIMQNHDSERQTKGNTSNKGIYYTQQK